jgi:V/A-type H+/Na+-transporting ATPase subunit C
MQSNTRLNSFFLVTQKMVNPDTDDYLSTRLDLMVQRLLSMKELSRIVHSDLEQIPALIQSVLPHHNLEIPLPQLRKSLSFNMYQDFQRLLRPFHGNDRRFLKQTIRWFELVNLKVLIRGKFTGVKESALRQQLVDLGEFADLPVNTLLETDDPFEMLRLLEQTAYGSIVRQARRVFEEQGHDLFSLDSAIDRNFFIEIAHRARFLSYLEQTHLKKVFGVLMDRFNLMWLLRYRFSYGLSSARSYYLLTATGNQLHSTELMKLAQLETLGAVVEQLPEKLKQLLSDVRDIYQVEQLMEMYTLAAAKRGLSHQLSDITRLFSYFLLREAETRFLLAVIKGKDLGFSDELLRQAVGEKD